MAGTAKAVKRDATGEIAPPDAWSHAPPAIRDPKFSLSPVALLHLLRHVAELDVYLVDLLEVLQGRYRITGLLRNLTQRIVDILLTVVHAGNFRRSRLELL